MPCLGRDDAVDRTVALIVLDRFVFVGSVVNHLDLHAGISGIRAPRGTDADAIVRPWCELELYSEGKIVVFLGCVEEATPLFLSGDRAIDDLVAIHVPFPAIERLAVEQADETLLARYLRFVFGEQSRGQKQRRQQQ